MDNTIKRRRASTTRGYVDPLYAVACLIMAIIVAQVAADALWDRATWAEVRARDR